ncbi:UbiA family prenyltransferase [Nocardioides sp. MH1]|uniref:UbiA family prenyltransferase n=1 Tax=Nocardioides sp. MH1 TaxID=3242490 RepID=UPI003520C43F
MTSASVAHPATNRVAALLTAAHIGPGLAVTVVVGVLAATRDVPPLTTALLVTAVFTGQLTVGWGNDLADVARDRAVGRSDKPIATGALPARLVTTWLWVAGLACVALSVAAGWRCGLLHLALGVGPAHAYNLWFKATALSWLPYAVAFGALPVVVFQAGPTPSGAPWWMVGAAAGLGVAAHLLNAVPDLADDVATGVRGLPHRLGAGPARLVATLFLTAASAASVLGPPGRPAAWAWGVLGLVLLLAALALGGRGRAPFRAAIAIALLDVVLLALASR